MKIILTKYPPLRGRVNFGHLRVDKCIGMAILGCEDLPEPHTHPETRRTPSINWNMSALHGDACGRSGLKRKRAPVMRRTSSGAETCAHTESNARAQQKMMTSGQDQYWSPECFWRAGFGALRAGSVWVAEMQGFPSILGRSWGVGFFGYQGLERLGRGQYGWLKCKDFQAFWCGAGGSDFLRPRVWSAQGRVSMGVQNARISKNSGAELGGLIF